MIVGDAFEPDARFGVFGDAGARGASLEPPAILLVEHDPEVGRPLAEQLAADGYRASLALTAEHARVIARDRRPAAVILGALDTPRGALDLLREIRGLARGDSDGAAAPWREDLPAVVLGSPAHHLDLVRAFEAGADDFLARPIAYLELRVRLRALLRRAFGESPGACLEVGPLCIDNRTQAVTLHGHPVRLRRLEYCLLVHLAREPTRVFTRRELLREVWGFSAPCSTRTLDSHASRLRRALSCEGHRWVINVRGVGYRLT
ncbi:MAG: response regulator transcription factor [Solirubrobacterales bacterium]